MLIYVPYRDTEAEQKDTHDILMRELENEYQENEAWHKLQRTNDTGIQSTQISALVMLLIKKGVLK